MYGSQVSPYIKILSAYILIRKYGAKKRKWCLTFFSMYIYSGTEQATSYKLWCLNFFVALHGVLHVILYPLEMSTVDSHYLDLDYLE